MPFSCMTYTVPPGATLHFEAAKPWLALPVQIVNNMSLPVLVSELTSDVSACHIRDRAVASRESSAGPLVLHCQPSLHTNDVKMTYLIDTVDPKLLKGRMASYVNCQSSNSSQDECRLHVDSKRWTFERLKLQMAVIVQMTALGTHYLPYMLEPPSILICFVSPVVTLGAIII